MRIEDGLINKERYDAELKYKKKYKFLNRGFWTFIICSGLLWFLTMAMILVENEVTFDSIFCFIMASLLMILSDNIISSCNFYRFNKENIIKTFIEEGKER